MGFVELYLLFATTTALAGLYELVYPVLATLKKTHPELTTVRHPWMTYTASFFLIFSGAPVFFPVVIVPSMGNTFKVSLHKSLTSNQV
jgi:hypothetical protein